MATKKIIDLAKRAFNNKPWYLIFAVTAKCNLRCGMCFYWKNIENYDPGKELSLREIERIAPQFDNLFQLTLSGGEPLLREDCLDIAKVFASGTPVRRITLTSNGMMPEKIERFVTGFCIAHPGINLSVNLSVDGLEKTHDRIRSAPGSFRKFLESFDLTGELKKRYKNLGRATATTVSTQNQDEVFALLDFCETRLDIANHGLMLARGSLSDESLSEVPFEKFRQMLDYLNKKSARRTGLIRRVVEKTYQARRIRSMEKRLMLDPCLAGKKLLILDEAGGLSPCELLEPLRIKGRLNKTFEGDFVFGNFRDHDYNLKNILSTGKAKSIIKFIEQRGCACSFECAMISNFFLNKSNYPRIMGNIARELLNGRPAAGKTAEDACPSMIKD